MTRVRNSVRALVVIAGAMAGLPLAAALAGPALADSVPNTAYDAGPGLTVSETLGLYVGIPLLVIAIVYALVYALTGRRGPRYPAGGPWTAVEQWFGDRPKAEADGAAAHPGAGDSADPAGPADSADVSARADGEGGARGRW